MAERLYAHRISGYDFVRAMLLHGFRLIGTTGGRALITKGNVEIWVRQVPELGEEEITAHVLAAGLSPIRFMTLLNRLGSRDTWSEQGAVESLIGIPPTATRR